MWRLAVAVRNQAPLVIIITHLSHGRSIALFLQLINRLEKVKGQSACILGSPNSRDRAEAEATAGQTPRLQV